MRLAALAVLAVVVPAARADDPPIRKLHVLLAIDTASNLKDSVAIDHHRVERLFRANVPADRLAVRTLKGPQLTAAAVLAHYKAAKAGPTDALLFYYAGHGAKDPAKGHAFLAQMQNVPPVFRSDVLTAMTRTGAGLVVVASDCCSSSMRVAGKPYYGATRPVTPASATGVHPTLEALFFRHRGVVDLTAAADGQASWSDTKDGGVFTRTLVRLLGRPPADFDADKDGRLAWAEFFPALRKETEATFRTWRAEVRGRGEEVDQAAQVPVAFSLGRAAKSPPAPGGQVFGVVCLVNESGEPVKYKYRWSDRQEWKSATMAPGRRGEHANPLAGGGSLAFQVWFDGNKSAVVLEADSWTGATDPPPGAAGREYPIRLRK